MVLREFLEALAPDLMDETYTRLSLLERISALEPVGRRSLAARLHLSEREVRAIADTLKSAGLIEMNAAGMVTTETAKNLLGTDHALDMLKYNRRMSGIAALIARKLRVDNVVIVPGDAGLDERVLGDVAKQAATRIRSLLRGEMVVALAGGRTMRRVVDQIPNGHMPGLLVIPARGNMGRNVASQADVLAADFAARLGGHNMLLQSPDMVDENAREALLQLPQVRQTLAKLAQADMVIYGVGRADTMARRRDFPEEKVRMLLSEKGAVAEAFGQYFNAAGQPIWAEPAIGMDAEMLLAIRTLIQVAAGEHKADAMLALLRYRSHHMLVTDESAAQAIAEKLRAE